MEVEGEVRFRLLVDAWPKLSGYGLALPADQRHRVCLLAASTTHLQLLTLTLTPPRPPSLEHLYPFTSALSELHTPKIPPQAAKMALDTFYRNKIEQMKLETIQGQAVLRRLEAQRNEYNSRVRLLREELGLLQQPGSYVGEVVKVMGTKKVLVKVHPEGKYGRPHHTS